MKVRVVFEVYFLNISGNKVRKMTKKILVGVLLWLFSFSLSAADLYFVDAHSQFEGNLEGNEIIQNMDKAGVRQAIISTRRGRSPWDAVELADAHPDRIVPSVRIKGKHYSKNTKKFFKKLKKQVKSEEFRAMGEVLMFHAQKGNKADAVEVHANDNRIQESLSFAVDNRWPFVVHIEFASLSSRQAKGYMKELEGLLSKNPDHSFMLIHMGQLDATKVGKLLKKYSNVHFLTSHADTISTSNSKQPWINMFDGEKLKPKWKKLMIKYPSQFVFAVDAVWADQWRLDYVKHVKLWRKGLSFLPEDIANKIAHGNAERLWGIGGS